MCFEDLSKYCNKGSTYSIEMLTASNGITLKVVKFIPPVEKNRPAVVFIPGWISLISGWTEVLKEMTQDFHIYYIETREKISSLVQGKIEYSIKAIGQDIIDLISQWHLRDNEYILLGSSLGATVILDCARFLKTKPLCFVLIGPNAHFRMPRLGLLTIKIFPPRLYLFLKPIIKWYLKKFRLNTEYDYAQYVKYCEYLDAANPWKLKKAAISISKYTVWDTLKDIRIPTLIIGASKDVLHEPDNLHKMTTMIKQTTYVDLETNRKTHSKEMVDTMRQFINELARKI